MGQRKQFKAEIDAYIPQDKRPAYVRVWLGANYHLPTGEGATVEKTVLSPNFIDYGKTKVATKLSGMLKKEEVNIAIEVPEYPEWLEHADKVTLYVGLLTMGHKRTKHMNEKNVLAEDQREFSYFK